MTPPHPYYPEFQAYCDSKGIIAESIKEKIAPHFFAGVLIGLSAAREAAPLDPLRARIASEQMAAATSFGLKLSFEEVAQRAVAAADALLRELAK